MDVRPPGTVDWSALVPECKGIDLDALPWEAFIDASGRDLGVRMKWLVDPALGKNCMLLQLPPHHRAAPHWHTSDTVYLVTKGEFVIDGEGRYRPGQVRWIRGGRAYGSEGAGPEGCEFLFFSLGPYGQHDPEVEPPPLGRPSAAMGTDTGLRATLSVRPKGQGAGCGARGPTSFRDSA